MQEPATSTGLLTASSTIAGGRNVFIHGITLIPAAAASSITVTDGNGVVIAKVAAVANGASVSEDYKRPVACNGTPAVTTLVGAAAAYVIRYSLG